MVFLASCGGTDSDSSSPGAGLDSAAHAVDPLVRFREILPDSLLRRDGACPFECCVYGTWRSGVAIDILAEPRAGARIVGSIPAGEPFTAETGVVFVTDIQLIIVTDSLNEYGERRPPDARVEWSPAIVPGDTLVVLDYVGEGYHRLWNDGAVLEARG